LKSEKSTEVLEAQATESHVSEAKIKE